MQTLKSTGLVLDVRAAPGDTFVDVSRYHAAITNNNVITAKGLGNSLAGAYNGSTAYLDCGNDASLNITDAITIEAWVKLEQTGDVQYPVVKRYDWNLKVFDNGMLEFCFDSNDVRQRVQSGTGLFAWGSWHHIVGTYNGLKEKLFYDGIEINSEDRSGNIDARAYTTGIGAVVGNIVEGSMGYTNGTIDEVRIHNRALPAYEITDHYYEYASYLGVG